MKPVIVENGLADRAEKAAMMIRDGEIVAMVGASLYKDGYIRFWTGGKAAESPTLAVTISKELHERLTGMLQ